MQMHDARVRTGWLLNLCCWITRADSELAAQSNAFDRMTIIANALALLLVTSVAGVAWTAFWSSFLSGALPIALGMLCAALIFVFDQAVGASDWEVAGVLRTDERLSPWIAAKVGLRLVMALLLSVATATGVTLWLFGSTIDNHLQAQRVQRNAPIEQDYTAQKERLESRLLAPLEAEIETVAGSRTQAAAQAQAAMQLRDQAADHAAQARIEAGRQADGYGGRKKGKGRDYWDAIRLQSEAERLLQRAEDDLAQANARVADLDRRYADLTAQLETRTRQSRQEVVALDLAKEQDPRWVPLRNDPLMRYIALTELKADAARGPAVSSFNWMMTVVLVTFEMMFILVKMVFAPASVYTWRLIARTRSEAAQVSVEYEAKVHDIRRARARPNLRVVGGDRPNHPDNEGANQ